MVKLSTKKTEITSTRSRSIKTSRDYKYIIPNGLIMVIDTREQDPLFVRTKGLVKITDTLKTGDYSIRGFEDKICIERKQISDFFKYIASDHDKTIKKLLEIKNFEFGAIVVEADYNDLLQPQKYAQIHPNVVRGFFASCNVKYGIHAFCSRHRHIIEDYILLRFIRYYEYKRNIT